MRRPPHRTLLLWLALGLGTGRAPYAPGTVGTLVGVACYLALAPLSPLVYALTVVAMFVAGIYICALAERELGADDPSAVVFDEVVGYLVAMSFAPDGWAWVAAGFVAFRVFDILKPWPIRMLERRVAGGLGVMLDDAVAGVFAALVIAIAAVVL